MPKPVITEADIHVGDFFEDCAYHPCLCTRVSPEGNPDGVDGISLVDGSAPRNCSAGHCGLRLLTVGEVIHWKFYGPADHKLPQSIAGGSAKSRLQPNIPSTPFVAHYGHGLPATA